MNKTINYKEYIKDVELATPPETEFHKVPDSPVIPAAGDKIVTYMRKQFNSQVQYFTPGISSIDTGVAKHGH